MERFSPSKKIWSVVPMVACLTAAAWPDDAARIDALLAKANQFPAVQFEFIATTPGAGEETTIQEIMKVYRKGDRWRFESRQITPGQYTLLLPATSYSCLPGPEGCRTLLRSDATDDAFFNRVKDPTKHFKVRRITGHQTLDGMPCTVVEVLEGQDEMPYQSKIWIWDEHGFPVRIESQALPGSDPSAAAPWPTYESKHFSFDDIPESMFEPSSVRAP